MERVVSVNLNGRAFQLEEGAYDALRAYMGRAEASLADNPDKTEIVGDLEQAIADKANTYLSAHKTVVTAAEMARILDEMGPVNGAEDAGEQRNESARPSAGGPAPKRLYRLKEGAVISGVCTGMAAYFDLDVSLIRVLWILAAIFLNFFAVLLYVILMFVIPSANTSEEWAAAHGVPFNAQGVIDEAKRRYAEFEAKGGWRQWRRSGRRSDWKESYRAARAERRQARREWRAAYAAAPPPGPPVGYVTQVFAGLFAIIFGLLSAVITIAFLVAIFSLATTGAVFGYFPPVSTPIWLAIVVLIIVYAAIAMPVRAIRRSSYRALSGRRHPDDSLDGLLTIFLIGLFVWLAWRYVPEAHAALEPIRIWFNSIWISVQH